MRLRLSSEIPADLEEILDFIARDSPVHALRTVQRLRICSKEVAKEPMLCRLHPEIGPGVRLRAVNRYVILFRIHHDSVWIERIVHGSRNLIGILENHSR